MLFLGYKVITGFKSRGTGEEAYKHFGLALRNRVKGNGDSHSDITEASIMETHFHTTLFLTFRNLASYI
jgi:hypothetical protein